jgi:hypothetical protein
MQSPHWDPRDGSEGRETRPTASLIGLNLMVDEERDATKKRWLTDEDTRVDVHRRSASGGAKIELAEHDPAEFKEGTRNVEIRFSAEQHGSPTSMMVRL